MAEKEYYEREAVIEFIRSYRCCTDVAFHMEEHLNEIPAADVRPVVLCKECRHSAVDLENMRYCKCVTYYNHVQDDWFCADGEKREES